MWARQDLKSVIFKREAALSTHQITQPVVTSKQIKISEDKTVPVMGTVPPSANRVVPKALASFRSFLVILDAE